MRYSNNLCMNVLTYLLYVLLCCCTGWVLGWLGRVLYALLLQYYSRGTAVHGACGGLGRWLANPL